MPTLIIDVGSRKFVHYRVHKTLFKLQSLYKKLFTSSKVWSPLSLVPYGLLRDEGGLGYGGGGVPGGVSAGSHPSCLRSFILSEAVNFFEASAADNANRDSGLDLVR